MRVRDGDYDCDSTVNGSSSRGGRDQSEGTMIVTVTSTDDDEDDVLRAYQDICSRLDGNEVASLRES